MSIARFDTLQNAAGSKSVPVATVVDGSAKAWVNFNGTGTVAIRAAFNVSSITDNGVGSYSLNFVTPMSDTNYTAPAACQQASGRAITAVHPNSFNTGNLQIQVSDQIQAYDSAIVCVAIFR